MFKGSLPPTRYGGQQAALRLKSWTSALATFARPSLCFIGKYHWVFMADAQLFSLILLLQVGSVDWHLSSVDFV